MKVIRKNEKEMKYQQNCYTCFFNQTREAVKVFTQEKGHGDQLIEA